MSHKHKIVWRLNVGLLDLLPSQRFDTVVDDTTKEKIICGNFGRVPYLMGFIRSLVGVSVLGCSICVDVGLMFAFKKSNHLHCTCNSNMVQTNTQTQLVNA